MRPRTPRAASCAGVLALAVGMAPVAKAAAQADDGYATSIRPLLGRYCGDCHAEPEPEAELDLLVFEDGAQAAADGLTWELVRERLLAREMPPRGAPQPAEAERTALLRWVDAAVEPGPAPRDGLPGRTVLRRLNRFEVQNAVLDVLGVHVDARAYLPLDEAADGFDTIGSALSFTDAHLEGLLSFAEEVARAAVPWVDPRLARERRLQAADFEVDERFARGELLRFFTNGEATARLDVERAGEYELRAHASATRGGDELARLRVSVDADEVASFDVDHEGEGSSAYSTRVRLEAGGHALRVAFVNDYYEPEHPDPRFRDRNLTVASVVLRGPLNAPPPPSRGLALRAEEDLAGTVAATAEALWRRPLERAERERLLALTPPDEPAPLALRTALIAVLASPRFLFRIEREPLGAPARVLDGYELATRLAGFLWSSVPDERLRAHAADGSLGDVEVLVREGRRLLADARASRLFEGFATQWLQLRALREHAPDPRRFPAFDDELRTAMLAETALSFEAVLREERPLSDLVDPGFTFLNERLARHYGIDGVRGALMRRVPLRDRSRGGLLSQASVLTATSYPTRTSPVLRGKWALEVLFGAAPPPPPPDVPALPEKQAERGPRSLRALLEEHRSDPACSACHAAMDPLGFGLESYDAIGAWRAPRGADGVDTRGELPDGRAFDGPVALKRLLAADPRLARHVTERLLVYALGRALTPADAAEAAAIAAGLAPERETLGAVIEGIVRSEAFRTLRADGGDAAQRAGSEPARAAGAAR